MEAVAKTLRQLVGATDVSAGGQGRRAGAKDVEAVVRSAGEPVTVAGVVEGLAGSGTPVLAKDPVSAVRTQLSRLAADGDSEVGRVGPGRYAYGAGEGAGVD